MTSEVLRRPDVARAMRAYAVKVKAMVRHLREAHHRPEAESWQGFVALEAEHEAAHADEGHGA